MCKVKVVKQHRWSGWPGAFCLDCGQDDMIELAIANDAYDPFTDTWIKDKEKYIQEECIKDETH